MTHVYDLMSSAALNLLVGFLGDLFLIEALLLYNKCYPPADDVTPDDKGVTAVEGVVVALDDGMPTMGDGAVSELGPVGATPDVAAPEAVDVAAEEAKDFEETGAQAEPAE